jgi:ParB-like chromosome segregation protein Spo0J
MPVTIEQCRQEGLDEATIASMQRNGFFEPTDPIEERRDDLTGQIEDTENDLEQWLEELAELEESISRGRVRLARLRQQSGELPPAPTDDDE